MLQSLEHPLIYDLIYGTRHVFYVIQCPTGKHQLLKYGRVSEYEFKHKVYAGCDGQMVDEHGKNLVTCLDYNCARIRFLLRIEIHAHDDHDDPNDDQSDDGHGDDDVRALEMVKIRIYVAVTVTY